MVWDKSEIKMCFLRQCWIKYYRQLHEIKKNKFFLVCYTRDLKLDGCPLKEKLLTQSALLMNDVCCFSLRRSINLWNGNCI